MILFCALQGILNNLIQATWQLLWGLVLGPVGLVQVGPDPFCSVLCLSFSKAFRVSISDISVAKLTICEPRDSPTIKSCESTLRKSFCLLWCMWASALMNWLWEGACPGFSETFKCKGPKTLKRLGKWANRRDQAQVRSGIVTGSKSTKDHTTDLFFFFPGSLWRGLRPILLIWMLSFIHVEFALPQMSSGDSSKNTSPKTEDRKDLKWVPPLVCSPSVSIMLLYPSVFPTLSLPLCWMPSVLRHLLRRFLVLVFLVMTFSKTNFLILDHVLFLVNFIASLVVLYNVWVPWDFNISLSLLQSLCAIIKDHQLQGRRE